MTRTSPWMLVFLFVAAAGCESAGTGGIDAGTDPGADVAADGTGGDEAMPADLLPGDVPGTDGAGDDGAGVTDAADALPDDTGTPDAAVDTPADATADAPPPDVPCVPDCAGKACGDDGCGQACGTCPGECREGVFLAGECLGGQCAAGTRAEDCDDASVCTTDSCDVLAGCVHVPLEAGTPCGTPWCEDLVHFYGARCDTGGKCSEEESLGFACYDALDCTDDACDPAMGCSRVLHEGMCAIDGACQADGDGHPVEPCLLCDAARSTDTWTAREDGLDCGAGGRCQAGSCCVADCAGKDCGSDGCGGECGTCDRGFACLEGGCVANDCPAGYVRLAAGAFDQGSPAEEFGRGPRDETLHRVVLTRDVCVKVSEVTQAEFRAALGADPSTHAGCDDCPVEQVSWWDALAYCNALSTAQGLTPCYVLTGCADSPLPWTCTSVAFAGLDCDGYRLPTEAEWEYAARAGTTTATYNGDLAWETGYCQDPNPVVEPIAWYSVNACDTPPEEMCGAMVGCRPRPVKGRLPNAWGLYDMAGNVLEWTWDREADYPAGPVTDPLGPDTGDYRVCRGGHYETGGIGLRSAGRWRDAPHSRSAYVGFRPARTAP